MDVVFCTTIIRFNSTGFSIWSNVSFIRWKLMNTSIKVIDSLCTDSRKNIWMLFSSSLCLNETCPISCKSFFLPLFIPFFNFFSTIETDEFLKSKCIQLKNGMQNRIAENMKEKKVYFEQLVTLSNALDFQWCKTVRWKCEWSFFCSECKITSFNGWILKSGLEALWCLMHAINNENDFQCNSKWMHTSGEWCAISCGTKGITIFHLNTHFVNYYMFGDGNVTLNTGRYFYL